VKFNDFVKVTLLATLDSLKTYQQQTKNTSASESGKKTLGRAHVAYVNLHVIVVSSTLDETAVSLLHNCKVARIQMFANICCRIHRIGL